MSNSGAVKVLGIRHVASRPPGVGGHQERRAKYMQNKAVPVEPVLGSPTG